MSPLSLILAVSANRVIGRAGTLPWRFSEDLKYFRRITSTLVPPTEERAVIMGRKTHQSIGRALPKRHNIVVTRTPIQPLQKIIAPDCSVAASLSEAIATAKMIDPEPIIIGGASLYVEALPLATKLYITSVHAEYDGDVFLPESFPMVTHRSMPATTDPQMVRELPSDYLIAPSGWKIVNSNISIEEDMLTSKKVELSWVTMVRS